MAADTPAEDALASAFIEEIEWVSKHVTMGSLWNPLRAQKMIEKAEADRLKKFMVEEEQVADLIDILEKKRKLGEFYKLLRKKDHDHVIEHLTPLMDSYETQRSVNAAVNDQTDQGQAQIDAAVCQNQMEESQR